MKLLRILGVVLAISLFAGCEVWISFWGDAASDREIRLDLRWPAASYGPNPTELWAQVWKESGGTYIAGPSKSGGSSTTFTTSFTGLASGVYKVVVWDDTFETILDAPNFGTERGFTTDPIDLFLFSQYTVEAAATVSDWEIDGQEAVTEP